MEGSGVPKAFVLGKGLRAPRGWELALSSALPSLSLKVHYTFTFVRSPGMMALAAEGIALEWLRVMAIRLVLMQHACMESADMRRGEKSRFMMRPEYGYAAPDCKVPPAARMRSR